MDCDLATCRRRVLVVGVSTLPVVLRALQGAVLRSAMALVYVLYVLYVVYVVYVVYARGE